MKKLLACAIAALSLAAVAETKPVMLSLVTPVQIPEPATDITGFRLSLIYGECQNFKGLDIGIANRAAGDFTGGAIGGVNIANRTMTGAQIGLVNWNDNPADTSWEGRSCGLQLGIFNYGTSFCGAQDGVLNVSSKMLYGAQAAYVNFARDVRGAQVGYLNIASGVVKGCQVGLVNYTDTMEYGLQIGIVNIISENGWFPVLPIVNGHF